MIVISPHLDDAVLSVGQTICGRGARVATVFAGMPDAEMATTYDHASGFDLSHMAVRHRRNEDIAALGELGAEPVHGEFLDRPYRPQPLDTFAVESWLRALMANEDVVMVPMGIHHPDHVLVADLALQVALSTRAEVMIYEELPYRVQYPEVSVAKAARLTALAYLTEAGAEKHAAVALYSSQVNQTMRDCVFVPERIWRAS